MAVDAPPFEHMVADKLGLRRIDDMFHSIFSEHIPELRQAVVDIPVGARADIGTGLEILNAFKRHGHSGVAYTMAALVHIHNDAPVRGKNKGDPIILDTRPGIDWHIKAFDPDEHRPIDVDQLLRELGDALKRG